MKNENSSHSNFVQIQTIRHIVEECPQTRFEREINGLHKCNEFAHN